MRITTKITTLTAIAALACTLAWAAETKKDAPKADTYPIDTCVVSGEKLGGMGDTVKFDYQGREIRFCCPGCIGKFKADPAKYLKILDDAAKAKADKAPAAAKTEDKGKGGAAGQTR